MEVGKLREVSAIYDLYQQVVQNESFRHCILQNDINCVTQNLSIYQSSFLLTNFGIRTINSTFGEFDPKYLSSCFPAASDNVLKLICISTVVK
ncbi:MAG: hypothetical protein KGH71_02850 [Candidatus Micrarchaeota archaeon]|nr:hypothetical protein [Candidatus Micrarchaeota archaeon]